ncbi:MAG TPA: anti-sigma factor [Burkholderiales bacterium]|nr:anti-sigma factor [Burkholderiales bacterium]
MTREDAAKLLHAYVDGELDAAKNLEVEAYLAGDPAARAACERLREMSAAIRDRADYHAAPASLAARLRASVPAAPEGTRERAGWPRWLGPAAALAAVALLTWGVTLLSLQPGEDERIAREVLASHVRATLGNRLFDVASSDQHTVKPWLSARLAFSPPIAEVSAHGFELRGGRLDYVGGQSVAVLVYQRRQHMVDVFVWPTPAQKRERTSTRDGFNVESLASGGMAFWLVSDLNRNELDDLARLLAANSAAP